MAFFNEPYKGPFPNTTFIAPGLVPLVRPQLSAPMPLVSTTNSNKVIANQSTQSVAEPYFNQQNTHLNSGDQESQPIEESVTGPISVIKVSR